MGFDIKDLHIDDDSPEGRALKRIIAKEDVTADEAVRRALRRAEGTKTPAEEMWGLFSDPEDLAILESAMEWIKRPENVWR